MVEKEVLAQFQDINRINCSMQLYIPGRSSYPRSKSKFFPQDLEQSSSRSFARPARAYTMRLTILNIARSSGILKILCKELTPRSKIRTSTRGETTGIVLGYYVVSYKPRDSILSRGLFMAFFKFSEIKFLCLSSFVVSQYATGAPRRRQKAL